VTRPFVTQSEIEGWQMLAADENQVNGWKAEMI
jgi:hypothetical protein